MAINLETGSRVGELDLRLEVHAGDETELPALQRAVERGFIPGVLAALDEAVEERFGPEAILRVRELNVRWAVGREQLSDKDYLKEVGAKLAHELGSAMRSGSPGVLLRPSASETIVLFENQAHLTASFLSDRTKVGQFTWFHRGQTDIKETWSRMCAAGAPQVLRTLSFLARMGTLEDVAAALDAEDLGRARVVLESDTLPGGDVEKRRREGGRSQEVRNTPAGEPSYAPPGDAVNGASGSGALGGGPRDEDSPDGRSLTADGAATGLSPAGSGWDDGERAECPPGMTTRPPGAPPDLVSRLFGEPSSTVARARQEERTAAWASAETRFAGLFYLINPLLELEIPEHLWCAGIVEGRFLCRVARLLLGDEGAGDAAPRALCGELGPEDPALATIDAWAAAELREKSLKALAIFLERRAVPRSPDRPLEAEIDALTATLAPAGGRLGAHLDEHARQSVLHCAAVILHAFGTCLGRRLDRQALLEMIRIPGRIELDAEELRVFMSMEEIDIDIRKAGLDANPGWLPWLKCRMVFVFEDQG